MTKRIAVIGGGFFSQFHYEAWARLDNLRIVEAVYKSNDAGARVDL